MEKLLAMLKRTLLTANIFFVITGIITLCIGFPAFLANDTYYLFWTPGYFIQPMVCIGTGFFIFLVAAVGFYGTLKENYLVIMAYVAAMGIVPILHMSSSISSFMIREEKLDYLPLQFAWTMHNYAWGGEQAVEQYDLIQQDFKCCGANNASDWLPHLKTEDTLRVPSSCCSDIYGDYCTVDNAFTKGCSNVYVNYMRFLFDAIGYGGLFLALMQILIIVNVVSAMWLVKIARERNEEIKNRKSASP